MAEVFISYHEASAGELAEQIAEALDAAGISCWCARRDLPFGGDFARDIPLQIDACKVFLLILNDSAVHQSNHMENELGLAFGRLNHGENIVILPIEFGDFKRETWVKYYLVHIQSIRLPKEPDNRRIQRLFKQIITRLHPQSPPEKITEHGKCGDNVIYTLKDGVLTISGNGPMWDFDWNLKAQYYDRYNVRKEQTQDMFWWNARKTISLVEIQNGVTSIGDSAFYNCSKLTNVIISDSVTAIGTYAFKECVGLTSINIPDNVTYIGHCAFKGCTGLTSVNIPSRVTFIRDSTFIGCTELTNVNIPDSVTNIGEWAFKGCSKLASITIPAKIYISSNTFPCYTNVIRRVPADAQ